MTYDYRQASEMFDDPASTFWSAFVDKKLRKDTGATGIRRVPRATNEGRKVMFTHGFVISISKGRDYIWMHVEYPGYSSKEAEQFKIEGKGRSSESVYAELVQKINESKITAKWSPH